jgi:hypothetical protein
MIELKTIGKPSKYIKSYAIEKGDSELNDYFKPAYTRWFYSPQSFWGNIVSTVYWVKHSWQRAFRGWADCDWWSMDSYLIAIIIPMLKELKKHQHGYPGYGQASTRRKWDNLLDQMIEGFEAGDRVARDDYYMGTNADILELEPASEEVKGWIEASKKDQKIFYDKMKLFSRWFFALWD